MKLGAVRLDLAIFCHFGNILTVSIVFGETLDLLCNYLCYWANSHFCKCPNIEEIIQPSGHAGVVLFGRV